MRSFSRAPNAVYVQYGEADSFWDVSFTDLQMSYADQDEEDGRSISVWIDPQTGKVELNPGYTPESSSGQREQALFGEYRDAIVEALMAEVPETAEYLAFLQEAANDAHRADRIASQAVSMAEHLVD